jgi:glutamyl-Q tRNA(Asp) synthetase
MFEDLAWLGVTWETDLRRQSEHLEEYAEALRRLERRGLIYPSFETRSEIGRLVAEREKRSPWPRDPDGVPLYPGAAKALPRAEAVRRMAAGEPFVLRLDMERAMRETGALAWHESGSGPSGETGTIESRPQAWGDVVLARKDVPTSYHLSVVIDDALQGVSCVARGQDLFWATSLHRVLQALLGLPAPTYHHHRLVLDADGRKLSKSTHATALRALRAKGATPADVRTRVGM